MVTCVILCANELKVSKRFYYILLEIDTSSWFYSFLLHSAECHALTEFSTKVGHVARDLLVTTANQDSDIFAGDAKAGIARNVFVCI